MAAHQRQVLSVATRVDVHDSEAVTHFSVAVIAFWASAESLCDLQLRKEDYHLPTLGPKIIELGKEVSLGKGFHLIRY